MKCNWVEKKLGDLIESVSIKHKFDKKEIILINTSDVLEGKVLNHTFVKNNDLRGQFKKSFMKGDILYSEIRPQNKRFAFVDFDSEDYVASTKLMVLRRKTDEVTEQFLFQFLKSNALIRELQAIAESRSGTFPQITFSELSNITIQLPTKEEQENIGKKLSNLDKKIELNKQIILSLEEIAATLFKNWFVDFEFPDENGNPYKSSGGKMVESELGEMPNDFECLFLSHNVNFLSGGTPKTKITEYWNGDILFYTPKDSKNSIYVTETEKAITELGLSKCNSRLYPVNTVFITARGTVGNLNMANKNMAMNQSCFALEHKEGYQYYLFFVMKTLLRQIIQGANGAVFSAINLKDLNTLKIAYPPSRLIVLFEDTVKDIFRLLQEKELENINFSQLRDTVLPKLLSGEIELPIEEEVGH